MLALTGSIGTGKSTVVKLLKAHGVRIFDCDEYVANLYNQESFVQELSNMFFAGRSFQKSELLKVIMEDKKQREKLNNVVHPLVFAELKRLDDDILVDIPLLFESQSEHFFSKIIVVYCSKDKQVARLIKREGVSKAEALKLIEMQEDIEKKALVADIVIDNNGTIKELESEVKEKLQFLWR